MVQSHIKLNAGNVGRMNLKKELIDFLLTLNYTDFMKEIAQYREFCKTNIDIRTACDIQLFKRKGKIPTIIWKKRGFFYYGTIQY